ncbi:hypothetical protein E2C01_037119 [Portunus trituberculatus]|uniref:Uncharacterized protein n=1 Tax=Portunus trituberculatus TaxID=210409 RepID=A0A5B7F8H8_PORTR|nr:hypothetical protein [Portunus trituberculatus]
MADESLRTSSRALKSFSSLLLWTEGIQRTCVEYSPEDRTRLGRSRPVLYSAIRLLWSRRVCPTHRLPALGNSVLWKHSCRHERHINNALYTLPCEAKGRGGGHLGTREGRHHNKHHQTQYSGVVCELKRSCPCILQQAVQTCLWRGSQDEKRREAESVLVKASGEFCSSLEVTTLRKAIGNSLSHEAPNERATQTEIRPNTKMDGRDSGFAS